LLRTILALDAPSAGSVLSSAEAAPPDRRHAILELGEAFFQHLDARGERIEPPLLVQHTTQRSIASPARGAIRALRAP
jgi:hypothetical protein